MIVGYTQKHTSERVSWFLFFSVDFIDSPFILNWNHFALEHYMLPVPIGCQITNISFSSMCHSAAAQYTESQAMETK